MNFINYSIRAFRAEWIKLRRSGIFWLIIGMSAFIPLVYTLVKAFDSSPGDKDANAWEAFITGCYSGFAGFFFPIFLILIASRLAQIEHRSAGWKLIETQPVHRGYLFLAKWEMAMFLSLACLIGVLIFGLIGAGILSLTKSGDEFRSSSLDPLPMLALILRLWISSLGLLAIQFFLSIWVANFLFSFGIGLLALIISSIISGLNLAPWIPYSATILTIRNPKGSLTGSGLLHHEWLSILWMMLFLWIGYQWYRFRSWKFSFIPLRRTFFWVIVLILFAVGFWFIEKPVQLKRYSNAVIYGKIIADDTVQNIALLNRSTFDTLVTVPVVNNSFHFSSSLNLPLDQYLLATGNRSVPVFFSGNDSMAVEWKWNKRNQTVKIRGTRIAENEHFSNFGEDSFGDYFLEAYAHDYSPSQYASAVIMNYVRSKRRIHRYRTIDNIEPADDYLNLIDKLLRLKYLRMLDIEYPRMFTVYYPNDSLNYPKSVQAFREDAPLNDSTLVNFNEYREFLVASYHEAAEIPQNKIDSAYFNYVLKNAPPHKIRDLLLYEELKSTITYIRDSVKRADFISAYLGKINDHKMRAKLTRMNDRLNGLGRGYPFPPVQTMSITNRPVNLTELQGKFVIIDFWATWCAPCKREAPYFEQLAEKYTSENVVFVSISLDQDINAWRLEARSKSRQVMQLWATSQREIANSLGLDYIPRFMMIDRRGRILNMQMPMPSDPEFAEILNAELALF